MPVSIHYSFSMRYRDATTRSDSQTLATQVTPSVHYELALTNVTHNTCNAILLHASVKPCCDLLKQSTFPLLLLSLLYSNSSPHTDTFHAHNTLNLCSNSHIPQITTRRKTKLREHVTSQRHNRLRQSWIAGVAPWHAPGGNFSNYQTLVLAASVIIDADR